jgi:membrane protein DedA with SNARE-associated domain
MTQPRQSLSREPDGLRERIARETADVAQEVAELPQELGGAAEAIREDIAASPLARKAISIYVWLTDHAPSSTRGRVILAAALFAIVLAPSLALLYVTLEAGSEATQSWFGQLGYFGVFLANLASTATVFIPVPGLTAAAQALIASSGEALGPFLVGVVGGLGMAVGEITAYIAGMAGAHLSREEKLKAPRRLQPFIDSLVRHVNRLMEHYGMATLFVLAAVPNPLFEIAGLTAGATRFSFWKFMASVTPGKVVRGLLLAYLGEHIIFG